jgi:diguanylate cyclase (GGDEF)-like protein
MDIRAGLEPRDPEAAARTAALLTLLGSAVTLFFAVVQPPAGGPAGRLAAIGVSAVLLGLSFVLRRMTTQWPVVLWVMTPLLGVAAIVALDLATLDASAAGQVFLCLPVLYAAAQLRWVGAALTTAAAVAGDGLVVFGLEPLGHAVSDFAYVVATCVTMAAVLVRARSKQECLIAQLRRAAAIDPLTGLVTRRVLDEAAHAAIAGAPSDDGTALVLIDLDRFKSINDTYGHPVGDAVLVHVAEVLAAQTRSDTVVCRMGGDELAVLLPGCAAPVAARRAEELLEAVRATPMTLPGGTLLSLSISVGVAHAGSQEHALSGLYSAADAALYRAKRAGRGRVAVASA